MLFYRKTAVRAMDVHGRTKWQACQAAGEFAGYPYGEVQLAPFARSTDDGE